MKSVARVKKLAKKIDISALCEALVVRFTKSSARRADIDFFHRFILFTCATDFAEKEGLDLLIYLFFEVIP